MDTQDSYFDRTFTVEALRYRGHRVDCMGRAVDGADLAQPKHDIQLLAFRFSEAYRLARNTYRRAAPGTHRDVVRVAVRVIQQAAWSHRV